jgi:hypothetical protein
MRLLIKIGNALGHVRGAEPTPNSCCHRPGVAPPGFNVVQHGYDGMGKSGGVTRLEQLRGGKNLRNSSGSRRNDGNRGCRRLEHDIRHRFKSGGNDHYSAAVPNG